MPLIDPVPPLPGLQPTVPDPPTLEGFCRLYGRLTDISGRPLPFQAVSAWFAPTLSVPAIAGGVGMVGEPVEGFTDRNGDFFIDAPQDVELHIILPRMKDGRTFTVPTLAVAPLFAYLFPYPVCLYWVASAADDEEGTTPVPESPPGYYQAIAGEDVYLALAVKYSNGFTCRLLTPKVEVSNADETEFVGSSNLRILRTTPGTAVISCVEEMNLGVAGSMWERAGYSEVLPPYFVPRNAYHLNDVPELNVVFV